MKPHKPSGSDTWPFRSLVDPALVDLQDLPNIFAISPEQGAQADPNGLRYFMGHTAAWCVTKAIRSSEGLLDYRVSTASPP